MLTTNSFTTKSFTTKQKRILKLSIAFAAASAVTPAVNAMHIMEGYLPAQFCIAWGIVCIPFWAAGIFRIKNMLSENRKSITLLAMAGAFVFVLSALKIPSVTGSCSHMTGTGLGAILFGPGIVSILGAIVLLFQALLLAHGGLTTLGANTFSMAVAGPLLAYGVYMLCRKCRVKQGIAVFLSAMLGDLATYCVTALQLAAAFPGEQGGMAASAVEFLAIFAPTQIPLAVVEGLLTVMIMRALQTYAGRELAWIGKERWTA